MMAVLSDSKFLLSEPGHMSPALVTMLQLTQRHNLWVT
jgi:hypothetical protein